MDPNKYLDLIERISDTYGSILGTSIVLFILVIGGLLIYFHQRLKGIADLISTKALERFKSDLSLLNRDEQIRTNYKNIVYKEIFEANLRMHKKLYTVYFNYQNSWGFTEKTSEEEWNKIWKELNDFRQEIFRESILLGENTHNILQAVVNMSQAIDASRYERKTGRISDDPETTSPHFSRKASDFIDKSQKWISENLLIRADVRYVELTPEEQKLFNEVKGKRFQSSFGDK